MLSVIILMHSPSMFWVTYQMLGSILGIRNMTMNESYKNICQKNSDSTWRRQLT